MTLEVEIEYVVVLSFFDHGALSSHSYTFLSVGHPQATEHTEKQYQRKLIFQKLCSSSPEGSYYILRILHYMETESTL